MAHLNLTLPKPLHTPKLLQVLVYPGLIAANVALVVWALAVGASLELVTMAALLGSLVLLFVLEWAMPHRREWHPSAKEVLRDGFYFGLNGGIDAAVKLGIAALVGGIGVWSNGLHLALAIPLAIVVADFFGYWAHRVGHVGWLWKVHGVHHTPDKVNTWNNNTIHFLNTVYGGVLKTLPLALLGFSSEAILAAAFVLTLQSFAVHANIEVKLGWLGYLIMGPAHHRLHHSTVVAEAQNFATGLTLWDSVFGTFVYGPDREPAEVGVGEPLTFPTPTDVLRNQLHPFVDQGRTQ